MPNPLSYFGVKGGGASESRTKVDEAVDRFKWIVLDEKGGGSVGTLSRDFSFLKLMVWPKSSQAFEKPLRRFWRLLSL